MSRLQLLRLLCRALALGLNPGRQVDNEALAAALADSAAWPELIRIGGEGLVTPSLGGALRRSNLFERIPAEVRHYLHGMQELNRERNDVLREELHRVIGWLNDIGIRPVLLKGAINLVTPQYPGSEDRVIGDLDLLVPEESLAEAFRHIQQESYSVAPGYTADFIRRHHHAPPVLHASRPVAVELHRHLCRQELRPLLPASSCLENATGMEWQGRALQVPSATDRVMHTFVHNQLQDPGYAHRFFSLRSLTEFCGQAGYLRESLDWLQVDRRLAKFADSKPRKAWLTWLQAARDLYGLEVPPTFAPGGAARRRERQVLLAMTSRPVNRTFYWLRRLRP